MPAIRRNAATPPSSRSPGCSSAWPVVTDPRAESLTAAHVRHAARATPAGVDPRLARHHPLRVPGRSSASSARASTVYASTSLSRTPTPTETPDYQLPEETVILRPDRRGRARPIRRLPARQSSPSRRPRRSCSTRPPRSRTRRSGRTPASTPSAIVAAGAGLAARPGRGASTITQQLVRARLLPEDLVQDPDRDDRAQAQGDHPVHPADAGRSRARRASSRSSPPT